MTKLQLTLTPQEAEILTAKAARIGYGLTRYVKYLISKETIEVDYPTITMSSNAEKISLQARKDHENGKTIEIKSFSELDSLL